MPAKAQRYADVIEFLDGVVIVLASRFEVGDKPRETEAADDAKAVREHIFRFKGEANRLPMCGLRADFSAEV